MSAEIYQMPLNRAIRDFSMDQLRTIFSNAHPACLAGVLKAKQQLSEAE
ncbi:hypothetical protein [Endozoicomonas ascidiicola]|nr:hypothetical protein [Endozoicomonas ascidiicola]